MAGVLDGWQMKGTERLLERMVIAFWRVAFDERSYGAMMYFEDGRY